MTPSYVMSSLRTILDLLLIQTEPWKQTVAPEPAERMKRSCHKCRDVSEDSGVLSCDCGNGAATCCWLKCSACPEVETAVLVDFRSANFSSSQETMW